MTMWCWLCDVDVTPDSEDRCPDCGRKVTREEDGEGGGFLGGYYPVFDFTDKDDPK
jgi:hypothetical protein